MRRFIWRLQRLLDIKIKQEEVKRGELISVTQQAATVRGQLMMQRTLLRLKMEEVADADASKRIAEQRLFLDLAHVVDLKITQLEEQLAKVEELRQEKMREVMEIRKFRKGLERIREKDKTEFIKEQERLEQIDLDDKTSVRYARNILQKA